MEFSLSLFMTGTARNSDGTATLEACTERMRSNSLEHVPDFPDFIRGGTFRFVRTHEE